MRGRGSSRARPRGARPEPWGQQRARRWPRGPWRAGAAVPAALPPTVPHSPFQPAGTPGPSVSPSRHHFCVRAWEREAAGLSLDGSEPRPRASAWRSRPRAPRERTSVGAVAGPLGPAWAGAGEEVLASAGGRCPPPAEWRRECPCFARPDGASQAVPGRQAGAGRGPGAEPRPPLVRPSGGVDPASERLRGMVLPRLAMPSSPRRRTVQPREVGWGCLLLSADPEELV